MSSSDVWHSEDELRDAISIRYGKDLYHNFGRSSPYHFFYAYKRFLVEIAKTLQALLQPMAFIPTTQSLGLYATHNQHKALLNAASAGYMHPPIISLYSLSRRALGLRLLVWAAKLVVYPFSFVNSRHRPALYQTCLLRGMVAYGRLYVDRLERLGVARLCISNDHAGDIFILSLLVRCRLGLSVDYVQHGAVKPSFPENYFRNIYVYSNKYAEIYRSLARNSSVRIIVDPAIAGDAHDDLPRIDVLICFSHQFPLGPAIALMWALRNFKGMSVSVRFHPSDRLSKIKLAALRFFYPIKYSDSKVGYATDFKRAKWILCASSSLLPDAVDKGFGSRLVWARQLGLKWDYYGLEGTVLEVSSASDFVNLLNKNFDRALPRFNGHN